MTTRHIASLRILLFIFVLLAGQIGALVHSVDHPFHEPTQQCDAFLALEKSKDIAPAITTGELPFVDGDSRFFCVWHDVLSRADKGYCSRAPPRVS
jgi:hypothetical protein